MLEEAAPPFMPIQLRSIQNPVSASGTAKAADIITPNGPSFEKCTMSGLKLSRKRKPRMTTRTAIEGQNPFQNLFEAAGVFLLIVELAPGLPARRTAPTARRPDYAARSPHRQPGTCGRELCTTIGLLSSLLFLDSLLSRPRRLSNFPGGLGMPE